MELNKKMTIFCIVIKGNDCHCRNYAWKNCDEQLCYQHRKLSDSFIKEEEIFKKEEILKKENSCHFSNCKNVCFKEIKYYKKKETVYACWKH